MPLLPVTFTGALMELPLAVPSKVPAGHTRTDWHTVEGSTSSPSYIRLQLRIRVQSHCATLRQHATPDKFGAHDGTRSLSFKKDTVDTCIPIDRPSYASVTH